MKTTPQPLISELNERSREIFRQIVDAYVATGEPIGSRSPARPRAPQLGPGRALVVMVTEDGLVENRVIEVPLGSLPATLISAGNYLNARLVGRTLDEAKAAIAEDVENNRAQLDELTGKLVETGLAVMA